MSDNEEKIITMEEVKTSPQPTTSQTKKDDPNSTKNGGLNALLFIGSFLIVVGSCSLLMSTVSDIIKLVILLTITIIFYIVGFLIRRVKILIPAGTAFICTSLAVMPFLGFAFSEFTEVTPEISWLLTSLIGTIAYIVAALAIKSRVIALFSMGFIISLFCSMPTNLHMATLWNYISVIMVSIIANLISVLFKEKVPTAYRDILTHTARWLAAAVAVATMFGTFSLTGYDYSIIFAICLAQFILSYMTTKDYTDEVLARLVAVPFILSIFWNIFPANSSEFALVAGLVCISEIAYSFFSSLLRKNERNREIPFIIIFLTFSIFCPLFAAFKPDVLISPNIIGIIITGIDLVFTILFAVFWKNKTWLIASYFFAVILPLYINAGENKAKLMLVIYALEFICFSIYYYFQKEKNRALENFNLIAFSALLAITRMSCGSGSSDNFAMSTQAESIVFNIIALIVPAFAWLIFGLKNENKNRVETSIYFFIVCIGITILQIVLPYFTYSKTATLMYQFIASNIVLFGLGLASCYRKSLPRAIIATSIFSWIALTTVYAVSISTSSAHYYYYSAIKPTDFDRNIELLVKLGFLAEEIILAVIGVVKHKKAIFWISAPIILLITLNLTQGMMWIWLILLGLALIGFVIWRLLKMQEKPAKIDKPQTPQPTEKSNPPETPSN